MTVNILGTPYEVETRKISDDPYMKKEQSYGYCAEEAKKIVVADTSEREYFALATPEEQRHFRSKVLRHEVMHAFLNESGLSVCSSVPGMGWAKHEEMVDWFAIQSPKIFQVFQELDIL